MKIEFVSYDGRWPNLCSGILKLKIDGVLTKFGWRDGCDYPEFWSSGGECGFTDRSMSDSYCNQGPWRVDQGDLPEHLKPYYRELEDIFNENVPYGCCGGCI